MRPRTSYGGDSVAPAKTWLFGLATIALICLVTPIVSVPLHGLLGFSVIFSSAITMGLVEGSVRATGYRVVEGIRRNKWLCTFAVWYLLGVVGNLLFRGHGVEDWPLMSNPALFLCGVWYVFAFGSDIQCRRGFHVVLICATGIQAILSTMAITENVTLARRMVFEGAWIYGEQGYYAMLAILLPIFVWRSLVEPGIWRVVLLGACFAILSLTVFSSYATALGLVLIGAVLSALVVVVLPVKGLRRGGRRVVVGAVFIAAAARLTQFAGESPQTIGSYDKFERFYERPESGGYSGHDLAESRWYKAELSVENFLSEPVWGKGGGSTRLSQFVGGHSSFLDSLGAYGLMGGGGALAGLVLTIFAGAFSRYWRERSWETLAGFVSVVLFAIAGVVNPYWEGYQPLFLLVMARPFLLNTAGESATVFRVLRQDAVFFKEPPKEIMQRAG